MTMYNVDATDLIEEVAKELQKVETIKAPAWASFVKTGASRERPPTRQDWWYVRAASVLRKVRIKGPIGVYKLKLFYGGKKNRGHQPEIFKKSSGNILRKILQQLEKAELVKQDKKGVHKGRVITPKGIKLMDNLAKKLLGNQPAKKPEEKPKVEKLAKKTKEFTKGKTEKPAEEAKKEEKPEVKKPKKENQVPKAKEEEKVPTAAELAKKAAKK